MSRETQTKITGTVARITFHNPENGYSVARLEAPGQAELVTVVGIMPGITEGMEVRISGRTILHPKFGPQIEVDSFSQQEPTDAEGVRRYLASGLIKGVGPVLAARIVDHLGPEAIDKIQDDPKALAKVPGIGAKKAPVIAQAITEHGALKEVMIFLQGHGITPGLSLRIFKAYGTGALSIIKTQPHRLAQDLRGIGFATADAIGTKIGIPPDDPTRLEAGLVYTLRKAMDEGHTFLPHDKLMPAAVQLLQGQEELLPDALERLSLSGQVVREGENIYLTGMLELEKRAARELKRIADQQGLLPSQRAAKAVDWVAEQLSVRPSATQGEALKQILTTGLGVLTGGPGTGKTTLVRGLITIAKRMSKRVILGAPTGRAAKRLSETCSMDGSTLHRLLEFSPKENRFNRRAGRPLEADLVVVDESSMIDTWLLCHLVEAIGPDTVLILVGDADQLPSVGPGLVFRQIIESGAASVARLSEIFRQDTAGLIVSNAHRVLGGNMPRLPSWDQESDFYFVPITKPEVGAEAVRRLVCEALPQRFGLDPVHEVQVLSPMHRGALGCQNLNLLMRETLNPATGDKGGLRAGDKVMQVRNNYDLEVFNGDVGLVSATSSEGADVLMSERRVSYATVDMEDLTLAYAVTIHKSQGSEYPCVVVVLGGEHFVMLNRPLLYTALTRGQRLVIVVGQKKALARAVEHAAPTRRHAGLRDRLMQHPG